jgi:hypothetical protein
MSGAGESIEINHEETKSTKKDKRSPPSSSSSSFLRG